MTGDSAKVFGEIFEEGQKDRKAIAGLTRAEAKISHPSEGGVWGGGRGG